MKTIKSITGILLLINLLLLSAGCEDFLTRDHPTQVTDDDFWKTTSECNSALSEIKAWPHGTYHTSFSPNMAWVHLEGATDNQYFMSNFQTQIVNMGNGSVTPTAGGYISNVWENYYIRIRKANRFLENVHRAYFADESERAWMIADARVWRAWYHMQLLLWYGRNDGIPIVDHSLDPDEIYMARTPLEDCIEWINSEFDIVLAMSDTDVPFLWDESRRARMSKSSALVLKMDLNLQYKKYDIAKECADRLINSGQFELHYTTPVEGKPWIHFEDMFKYTGKQNKERIMFVASGNAQAWFRLTPTGLGGQGTGAPLKTLIDEFETIDGKTLSMLSAAERTAVERDPHYLERDPRLYATVVCPGDNTSFTNYTYEPFNPNGSDYVGTSGATRSGYIIKKFLFETDKSNNGRGTIDFMLYRYAEVLLTYVECLVESGDWQNAKVEEYINMIRRRAGIPDIDKSIYNTQEKVRELYRRERRVELAFEGKRYDDIRRWGIGPQVMTGKAEGAWNPLTNSFVLIEERNCTFPKYDSWPLPQAELTSNPNITPATGW